MSATYFVFFFLLSVALSTTLNDISVDTTLVVNNNPYQVNRSINIQQGVTLTIPNGVEIILMDEYTITVQGIIDGCQSVTSNYKDRGLVFAQNSHIHSLNNDRKGGLTFSGANAGGSFCNVKFEGLNTAMRATSMNEGLSIDNCEFTNVNDVILGGSGPKHTFNDTYFHDLKHVIKSSPSIFHNCLFETLENGVSDSEDASECMTESNDIEIYGSDIAGNDPTFNGAEYCLVAYDNIILINNTFTNCDTAIYFCNAYGDVLYNTISDSNLAVHIYLHYNNPQLTMQYNNFVNNVMNIELVYDDNCPDCNYNYFGGTTQAQIGAKINDVCDGYSTALVTFWPWYTSMITDAANLPSTDTITTLECSGPASHAEITGNRLSVLYLSGTTTVLALANTPFYVINDIVVQEGATVNVENGVEIIFVADYDLIVRGSMNVGCYNLDTSASNQRGLANPATYAHIHSIDNDHNGSLTFDASAEGGQFCNVLFETVHRVNGLSFDNCEFTQLDWGINGDYFNDSYFHHLRYVTSGAGIFGNCLFEEFESGVNPYDPWGMSSPSNFEMYNSLVIGNGSQNCLSVSDHIKIQNNNITNCGSAIFMDSTEDADIRYNDISNADIGVQLSIRDRGYGYNVTVMYNNFLSAATNIELSGDTDCKYCNFNYFGTSSTEQTIIGATINDICDGFSTAIARWFPYYINPLDFGNIQSQTTVTLGVNDTFICRGPDNYPALTGSKFNVVYLPGTTTTLRTADSPYYVVSDVVLQEGAVINVPQDFEIIFVDDFNFDVRGTLNMGCFPNQCSTSGDAVQYGIYCIKKIHVYAQNGSVDIGNFRYTRDTDTHLSFCNVLFEGLHYIAVATGSGSTTTNRILFDNCEFSNVYRVGGGNHLYTDCKFYNFESIVSGHATFDHCRFESFTKGVSTPHYMSGANDLNLYNSEIIGDGTQQCLTLTDNNHLVNNTFENCNISIEFAYAYGTINYNTFRNNHIAVKIYPQLHRYNLLEIQYNNFMANTINIQSQDYDDQNCSHCNYNYFDISATTNNNVSAISSTMLDECDQFSTSLVTFWPWLDEPYIGGTRHAEDLRIFTFDFTDCASINSAMSYIVTGKPTVDPTADPTVVPTLDPTMAPTQNPALKPDAVSLSALIQSWDFIGYCIIAYLFILPVIFICFGLCFHSRKKGSDRPNYGGVLSCFANIADVYTDTIFCIALYLRGSDWWIYAAVFTAIPHILSNIIGLYTVHKWRKQRVVYVNKYDNIIIGLTLLAGFKPAVEFLSSKLFHLNTTSLQLTQTQMANVKKYRFFTNVLLENGPLMFIQIMTILEQSNNASVMQSIDPITALAFTMSLLSLIVGILTLISRACGDRAERKANTEQNHRLYRIDIKSAQLRKHHRFIHSIFANALSHCLQIEIGRIETISIIPIVDGSSIVVDIALRGDKHRVDEMLRDISSDSANETKEDFKTELCRKLKVKSLQELRVTVSEMDDGTDAEVKGDLEAQIALNAVHSDTGQNIEMVEETQGQYQYQ